MALSIGLKFDIFNNYSISKRAQQVAFFLGGCQRYFINIFWKSWKYFSLENLVVFLRKYCLSFSDLSFEKQWLNITLGS